MYILNGKEFTGACHCQGKPAEHLVNNVMCVSDWKKTQINTFETSLFHKKMGKPKHESVFVLPPADVHVQIQIFGQFVLFRVVTKNPH